MYGMFDVCRRYICIDAMHRNDESGMYTVYCRN